MGCYYLAGPMRGIPQFNFPAFFRAAELLRAAGMTVVSPAEHDVECGFDTWSEDETGDLANFKVPNYTIADAIKWDLEVIASDDCNGIIFLPGWENSSGAKLERQVATFIMGGGIHKELYDFTFDEHAAPGFTLRPSLDPVEKDNLKATELVTAILNAHQSQVHAIPNPNPQPEFNGVSYGKAPGFREEDLLTIERRVRNEETGGEKGQKLARFDLIPSGPLWQLAELYGKGALKYAERNWELGYDWSLSFAAAMRHLHLFWQGEDVDPETGVPHPLNAAFHCFAMVEFLVTHPELDDRPKTASAPR